MFYPYAPRAALVFTEIPSVVSLSRIPWSKITSGMSAFIGTGIFHSRSTSCKNPFDRSNRSLPQVKLEKRESSNHGTAVQCKFSVPETLDSLQTKNLKSTNNKNNTKKSKTPVHWRIPLLGNYVDEVLGITGTNLSKIHGPIYRTNVYGKEVVVVADRSLIEIIGRDNKNFRNRNAWPKALSNAIGTEHLANIDGATHAAKRATLQPMFCAQTVLNSQNFVYSSALNMWEIVRSRIQESGVTKLFPLIYNHMLDCTINQTTGGNLDIEQVRELKACMALVTQGLFMPRWTPSGRQTYENREKIIAILKKLLRSTILRQASVINTLRAQENEGSRNLIEANRARVVSGSIDLLTVLLAYSGIPTDLEHHASNSGNVDDALTDLSFTILHIWWASADTSTSFSVAAISRFWKHPDILAQLVQEQCSVGQSHDLSRLSELGGLRKLFDKYPLLTAFLEENLRILPPVFGIMRVSNENTEVLGHKVKAGENVWLDLEATHRDPNIYEDPDEFKLERFLQPKGEKSKKVPPVLSFGVTGAVHICIGSAMARANVLTTIKSLICNYDIEFDPSQDASWKNIPIPRPVSGLQLCKLEPRAD